MGPHGKPVPPAAAGAGVDHVTDQVIRMAAIVTQARVTVPGLRWKPPPLGSKWHLLEWEEGGEVKRQAEDDLKDLADWAEAKWLPGAGPHTALIVEGSAYTVGEGPNTGRPANLGWPAHYPMEALCAVKGCGQVVRREKMDARQLDWEHTGRMPGEPR